MLGNWMKWCEYVKQDLSWKTLLALPQCLLSFCIGATYDTLPSPSNLVRWKKQENKGCTFCNKSTSTTSHILGACPYSLKQGRYTYRHDKVLSALIKTIQNFLSVYKPVLSLPKKINFVPEGHSKSANKKKPPLGLLHFANDWILLGDLDTQLIVPPYLAVTQLRPDILLISKTTKKVIIIELTCPCEENMPTWHEKKYDKYSPLCAAIKSNGWSVNLFAVEVGARGYCSETVRSCLRRLGFTNKLCRSALKSLSTTSMKCSFYIFLSRDKTAAWKMKILLLLLQKSLLLPNQDLSLKI